ncbi:MAG: peroxiredoxin-like family protein [Aeromicrobium sp.]
MISVGDKIAPRILTNLDGQAVPVPNPTQIVHLQFRRHAGCPICNTHLRSVTQRLNEIEAAGIREVVFFHSSAELLREHQQELPFDVIPDPDREVYSEFGVEKSWRAILTPKIFGAMTAGYVQQRGKGSIGTATESHLGMPADFLIDTDGTVLAAKYGEHGADQWSVEELLAQVP